jgi:3-oxoacyl-[acyl-carrier protein] reductase
VAVVTGAGQGIGRAVAEALAADGLQVVIVDRNPDRGERVASEIGSGAVAAIADVTDEAAVARVAAQVMERFGRWDVLVNNAGKVLFGDVETTTVETWDAVFDGNIKSTWLCTRAAAPHMKLQRSGRVICFSSIVALGAEGEGLMAYTTSKAAVLGFVKAAARELGPYGVTVNAVVPGTVKTDAWQKFPDPDGLETARSAVSILGRVAEPRELARAVAYLASPDAGFVTAQTLVVDGGRIDKI